MVKQVCPREPPSARTEYAAPFGPLVWRRCGAQLEIDLTEYRRNGYACLRGLFAREEVQQVRADAENVFRAQMRRVGNAASDAPAGSDSFARGLFELFREDEATFINCGKQVQHLISLHRLALDERIVGILADLGIQRPNINTRPVLFFNSRHLARDAVYWKVDAHQDWYSMQGSLDSAVVWVALCDIDRSLGALEVVPGSHREGLIVDEAVSGFGMTHQFDDEAFIPVEVSAGDAMIFSSFLVHRSGNNSTPAGIRWSCHFRYNNLDDPTFVDRGFPHSFIYESIPDLITPGFPTRAQVGAVFGDA